MGTSNLNSQKEIECVLISDEDDDIPDTKTATKPGTFNTHEIKIAVDEHSNNFLLEDGDGRRVSRRRKNKTEYSDDVKNIDQSRSGRSNGNDHINDTYKNSPNSSTSNTSADRKFGITENRAETRSRKRERTPSPVPVDTKETDPNIQYKEILSGLEGAAFQSR